MTDSISTYNVDVLIVGGGSAGMWAAKRIKELAPEKEVAIVDKGPIHMGGLMAIAGGDMDVVMPDDDVEDWIKDLTYYWDGLCDQDELRQILNLSFSRFKDYESYGCNFYKNDDGSYRSIPQRSLKHCRLYPAATKGTGGLDMVMAIRGEIERLGVKRICRTVISDLIMEDGQPRGAVGFNIRTGRFIVVTAKAVLLATGQAMWKPAYGQNTATGEGLEMAFRAGAELRNFEFIKIWNVPKEAAWEGQTTLLPLGAKFINALGEPIMERYMPSIGSNTDPHYITRAMALEVNAGRGPIYLDPTPIKKEDMVLVTPETGWQRINNEMLISMGIDILGGPTEWVPHAQDTLGGICADLNGRTRVRGLFAAGRTRNIDAGVYMGGFAIMTTAVTGYLAGEGIVEFLAEDSQIGGKTDISPSIIEDKRRKLYSPLGKSGIPPHEIVASVRELIFPHDVCILKNATALNRSLNELYKIKEGILNDMSAKDPHYLYKSIEARGMVFSAELFLRASLERKESRAGHFRMDFPKRDPAWLAWLIVSGGDRDTIEFNKKPVPVEKYKHPINSFYSDQFIMENIT